MTPTAPAPLQALTAWRLALSILKRHRGLLASALLWRLLFRLLPVQIPLLTGALIDGLSGRSATIWGWAIPVDTLEATVQWLGIALATVAVATGASAYSSARASGALGKRTVSHLRRSVIDAWQHASASFHRRFGASTLFDCTLSETRAIGRLARDSVVEGIAAVARFAYPAAMLVMIDPAMATLPLAALPLQVILTRFFQSRQGAFSDTVRNGKSRLSRSVKEALDGIETVQALRAQPAFRRRIESEAEALDEERDRSGVYGSSLTASVWALAALALAGSWWIGGARVASGEISAGQLVAFAGFVGYLAVPLRRFARLARGTRESLQSLRRIAHMLNASEEDRSHTGTGQLVPRAGEITLSGVTFGKPERPILQELKGTFPAGEFIWLRGPSGCGKSTMLRLLARLDAPSSGTIALDGQDLRECTADSVRKAVVLVPQQAALFSGTIAGNLKLGHPSATTAELLEACRLAGLGEMPRSLKDGFETEIGENGIRLSGGEAQRLSVARALLCNPRVLLLDEPTSALDPEAEAALMETLAGLRPRATVILVAHQLRCLHGIDRVVEFDSGRLSDWTIPAQSARRAESIAQLLAQP